MRFFIVFLLVFQLGFLHSQKLVRKAFIGPEIESIHINANQCYQVSVETYMGDEIFVSANMEGEYAEDLLVSLKESGKTIFVDAGFQPNFVDPNDKLSAHKVVSIALQVQLPEYKEVHVYGTQSHVDLTGKYRDLEVSLSNGRCTIQNASENVTVTTQTGDIFLTVPNGNIRARSNYGKIHREHIPLGNNQFILNTVEGDIHLKKTK